MGFVIIQQRPNLGGTIMTKEYGDDNYYHGDGNSDPGGEDDNSDSNVM